MFLFLTVNHYNQYGIMISQNVISLNISKGLSTPSHESLLNLYFDKVCIGQKYTDQKI